MQRRSLLWGGLAALVPPVSAAQGVGSQWMFQPVPGDVRLAVISDLNSSYGSLDYETQVIKTVKLLPQWRPDIVICPGDMVAGESFSLTKERLQQMWTSFNQQILGPMRKAGLPFGFTIGNHDASSAQSLRGGFLFQKERDVANDYWNGGIDTGVTFVDRGGFPFYYSFQQKGIFYLVWDASSNRISPEQLAWAEKSLASPVAQKAALRIVIGHLPLYGVAIGRNELGEVLDEADQRRALLERYGVHTYITGHHHAYYPGHRGKLQLLHTSALGSGARPLIAGGQKPQHTLTIVDVNLAQAATTYTTYNMNTLQVVDPLKLPRTLVSVNGIILRRDIEWKDLTKAELNACVGALGAASCRE